MKEANGSIIRPEGATVTIPYTSAPIFVAGVIGLTVQVVYASTNAEFSIQCSADQGILLNQSWTPQNVKNWTTISDSVVDVIENGDLLYDISDASYRWIRIVATGSGSITSLRFQFKGV